MGSFVLPKVQAIQLVPMIRRKNEYISIVFIDLREELLVLILYFAASEPQKYKVPLFKATVQYHFEKKERVLCVYHYGHIKLSVSLGKILFLYTALFT